MESLVYRTVSAEALVLDECELTARLGGARYEDLKSDIDSVRAELSKVISPSYAAARVKIKRLDSGKINLGFGDIESSALLRVLCGCEEAYVVACTLGIGADRLIMSKSGAPSRAFLTDAVASALAESLINKCCEDVEARDSVSLKPPFSPGYADLPLSHQPSLIQFLDAGRRLGIFLGKSYLMSPSKSITAICAIAKEKKAE